MCAVEQRLEQWMENHEAGNKGNAEPLINDKNRQRFINYLAYLEGLAPLIFRDILKLEHIDDLMAYRFFLALNNTELQEDQLFRYPEYYHGCFKLYAIWKSYRTKGGHINPLPEYSLDFWPEFETYSESPVSTQRLDAVEDRKKTAGLIYDTDSYIYPAAFGSRRNAMRVLPRLMDEDCVFHADNIRVAKLDGTIVGIAVLVDASSRTALRLLARVAAPANPFRMPGSDIFPLSQTLFPALTIPRIWSVCVWIRPCGAREWAKFSSSVLFRSAGKKDFRPFLWMCLRKTRLQSGCMKTMDSNASAVNRAIHMARMLPCAGGWS